MPMKIYTLLLIYTCGALFYSCSVEKPSENIQAPPAPKALTLHTADATNLAASYYPPLETDAPGVILVHGFARTHKVWDSFAIKLQADGYAVLSFDLRGHGENSSNNAETKGFQNFTLDNWLEITKDLGIAKKALTAEGVNPNQIAILGEELGANLALLYTVSDPEIAALVLLSPGLKYKGVESSGLTTRLKNIPLLIMAGEQDAYAASSARTLHAEAPGYTELRTYPGSANGSELLDSSPAARNDLFLWLKQHFKLAKTPLD
jgi:alpha-beta hydrolase superfamily lysophospholipase